MHTRALSLMILLATSACSSPSPPPQPVTPPPPKAPVPAQPSIAMGAYTLSIEPGPDWQRHTLSIKDIDSDGVHGDLQIDWGIGPEGRAPMPDERLHTRPWRAPLPDSGPLAFEVQIGDMTPTAYVFELWTCPDAGADKCNKIKGAGLAGEVRISSERSSPGIWSVIATPIP